MNKVIIYIQHNQKRVFKTCICTAVQRQKAASAYYTSKHILPLVSAEQCKLCKSKFLNLVNVFEDFMFSGKAFHIITPVYDKDL